MLYVNQLDLLTQKAIHGRDHFVPEDLKALEQEPPFMSDFMEIKSDH